MKPKIQGIILAGGQSSRMGQNKALLLDGDQTFIEKEIDLMHNFCTDLLIVGNPIEYEQFGLPVFPDIYNNKGPLGGIYTGLTHSKQELNLVVSCDLPKLQKSLLEMLLVNYQNEEVFICAEGQYLHPLIGLYKKSIAASLKKNILENQLKLSLSFEQLNWKRMTVPASLKDQLFNLNSKEDLRTYLNQSH